MTDAGHKARQRMLVRALARFSGRPQHPSSRTRTWVIWIAGVLALVLGFLVTLWLTHPAKPLSPTAKAITQSLP
jgi:cytochrome c-type biogenesis protein CcmH/NrfF